VVAQLVMQAVLFVSGFPSRRMKPCAVVNPSRLGILTPSSVT